MKTLLTLLLCVVSTACAAEKFDVVVYGGTAGGAMAAVSAARRGLKVVLIEPGSHIGGMVSGGLSWTDVGDARVLGGLARRFYQAVADHYRAPLWQVKGPEPHVAERLLEAMLERAGVDVRLGTDELPEAAVTVDASYEGDVVAARGVPYRVGREPRKLHGERWAGRQPAYRPGKHNFADLLSPFADDGSLSGERMEVDDSNPVAFDLKPLAAGQPVPAATAVPGEAPPAVRGGQSVNGVNNLKTGE